jgi:uncharacterized protein (DUF1778 family)
MATFTENVTIQADLTVLGSRNPALARSELSQDDNKIYSIPWTAWRVWDAFATNLPGTAASDDLSITGGTWATNTPSIQTGDLKAAGSTTRYARATFELPPEYVDGQSVTIRASAGMVTTAADTAATIDFEVYKSAKNRLVTGSDLCATAATTINSTTFANKDFVVTAASLAAGDVLDVRMAILVNDAATVTAVIGCAGGVDLLLDVKG